MPKDRVTTTGNPVCHCQRKEFKFIKEEGISQMTPILRNQNGFGGYLAGSEAR